MISLNSPHGEQKHLLDKPYNVALSLVVSNLELITKKEGHALFFFHTT